MSVVAIARLGVPGNPEYLDLIANVGHGMLPCSTSLVIYAVARDGGYKMTGSSWMQPRQPDPNK